MRGRRCALPSPDGNHRDPGTQERLAHSGDDERHGAWNGAPRRLLQSGERIKGNLVNQNQNPNQGGQQNPQPGQQNQQPGQGGQQGGQQQKPGQQSQQPGQGGQQNQGDKR
jgi:hypothetical protein